LDRRRILASKEVAGILTDEWRNARNHHGWVIGRYVIMPEHLHFFCKAELGQSSADLYAKMERMEQ
jgi:REP element-mobilizing transposase RayT